MEQCQHIGLFITKEDVKIEDDSKAGHSIVELNVVRCQKCSTAISAYPIHNLEDAIYAIHRKLNQIKTS